MKAAWKQHGEGYREWRGLWYRRTRVPAKGAPAVDGGDASEMVLLHCQIFQSLQSWEPGFFWEVLLLKCWQPMLL